MAIFQSAPAQGLGNISYPRIAGVAVSQVWTVSLPNTLALGDVVELAQLPGDTRLIDFTLICDDLDTGAAITLNAGIMSGEWGDPDATRSVGTELLSASDIARAGGVVRATLPSAFKIAPVSTKRSIGVGVAAAAAGPAAGTVTLITTIIAS